MQHQWTYQGNRTYRCDNCGLIVNKDTMPDHEDEECPNTGDLLSILARVDQIEDKQGVLENAQADQERRLLVLETPAGPLGQ